MIIAVISYINFIMVSLMSPTKFYEVGLVSPTSFHYGWPHESDQAVVRSASQGRPNIAIIVNGDEQKNRNEKIFFVLNDENYNDYFDFGLSSISTINLFLVLGLDQENWIDFKSMDEK